MNATTTALIKALATLSAKEFAPSAALGAYCGLPQGSSREVDAYLTQAACLGVVKHSKNGWALTATGRKVAKGI